MRVRLFWAALLGYPIVAVCIAAGGARIGRLSPPPLPIILVLGWPVAVLTAAWWWRVWPCPQCGHCFFDISRGARGTVFSVRACGHCQLPRWADEGGIPPRRESPADLADRAVRPGSCWFCGRRPGGGSPLVLTAVRAEPERRLVLHIPRCGRCACVHALERGMGAAAVGTIAFGVAGWLFVRGIDSAAGFGAAVLRGVPFAGLAFVLAAAGFLAGHLLSRPRLWGTRSLDAWEGHPDVARHRSEGWAVMHFEPSGSID
jgi:hypothetical protein